LPEGGDRVIEIGCGKGEFAQKFIAKQNILYKEYLL
jgi:cyclopropane fatty-acyl-phospholipid synthase-like methyltransferase